jgi:glutathione S-transferase
MNSVQATPILYSFRRCPYAMRARMALAVAAINYTIREVSLKAKPAEMLAASPKGTVPVLISPNGQVIDESLDIMHWALEQNDPHHWLIQNDEIANLIATNDGPFKFHLDRMKYANRYSDAEPATHRATAIQLLEPLEQRLQQHVYLFGDTPCLADIALFPFVRQFAHADMGAFTSEPLPLLQTWLAHWESSALFESVMSKQTVWQAI